MDANLKIIISAVDEASEALEGIGEELTGLSDTATETANEMSEVLANMVSPAALEQFDALTAAGESSADALEQIYQSASANISESFDAIATSATVAADNAALSLGEIFGSTDLADQIATDGTNMGMGMGKAMIAGFIMEQVGQAILGVVSSAINDAASKQATVAQGTNTLQNLITSAGSGTNDAAQIADLTAKIQTYNAQILEATANKQVYSGTALASAAAQAKDNAEIATAQSNLSKAQGQLQQLQGAQDLVGTSASGLSSQFSSLATMATQMGVPFNDAYNALIQFTSMGGSPKEATLAFNDALGLVANKTAPDMVTAMTDIEGAMGGRASAALKALVPNIMDNVSPMQALIDISNKVKDAVPIAMEQLNTQVAAVGTNMQNLGAAMGQDLTSPLDKLVTDINTLIEKMTDLANAHPKLAAAILIGVAAIGLIVTALGGMLALLGLVGIAEMGFAAVTEGVLIPSLIAWAAAELLPLAPWILIGVGVAALAAVVIKYHQQIWDFIKEMWSGIESVWTSAMNSISSMASKIWGTIKSAFVDGINGVIAAVNGFINAIDAIHINIPAITIPGTKIGTPAVNLGFNIPDIPKLAAGGVVIGPTLAMIGEAGPEAVIPLSNGSAGGIGGNQQVVINISSLYGTDNATATKFANMIAQKINRNLKLKSIA